MHSHDKNNDNDNYDNDEDNKGQDTIINECMLITQQNHTYF